MRKGDIRWICDCISAQERRTLGRWLKANAIVVAIYAAGLAGMVLVEPF